MREALDWATSAARGLPDVAELLVAGGDARLALDPRTRLNRYGCPPAPVPARMDFASSTASPISPRGLASATALHARISEALAREAPATIYARELAYVRDALVALNGLADLPGLDIAFAASGSDLHLVVAELVGGDRAAPLLCIGVEAAETGRGVPLALAGRHFSDRTASGAAVVSGDLIGPSGAEFVAVAARLPDGTLRDGAEIEAELDAIVLAASRARRRVLLTVADVSKTGLIAPSLEAVLALRRRFPRTLEVLVDACQLRLSSTSLRAYLAAGLMVAVTGSKFLTGPSFSGALLAPAPVTERLKARLLRPGFGDYSARAEWPSAWVAGAALPQRANFGLLLRWTAALAELEAFRALPDAQIDAFLSAFADAVEARLAVDPRLEPLPMRALDRRAIGADQGWDVVPTIFPFRLRDDAGPLVCAAAQDVYRALRSVGVRLGQPIACGALRLCASARTVTEALGEGGLGAEAAIDRALSALDYVSAAVPA
jgi:hypothetical protein